MIDCVEQFRTLRLYGVVGEEAEQARVNAVQEKFRDITKQQAVDFTAQCKAVLSEFYKAGPGAPGTNLDQGVIQVEEYQSKLATMKKQGKELMNAEGLFN